MGLLKTADAKKCTMLIKYRNKPTDCINIVLLFYIVCPSLAECYDSYSSKDVEILDIMVGLYDRNKLSITNYFVCKNNSFGGPKTQFRKIDYRKIQFLATGNKLAIFPASYYLRKIARCFLEIHRYFKNIMTNFSVCSSLQSII